MNHGTKVEFYCDENPGPLGMPAFNKISEYPEELKKWDPTDPDENNPWKEYSRLIEKKVTEYQEKNQIEDKEYIHFNGVMIALDNLKKILV